ncbi:MAG TPA: nitroreductase/quinone reductase family protein [Solirubrobacteraceae bacterium]|nr:nitroreductase/quinone reductase family protein [Solirubrobacteraceae bacterium]
MYFHDGDRVTIIASKRGWPKKPAWYHNLRRNYLACTSERRKLAWQSQMQREQPSPRPRMSGSRHRNQKCLQEGGESGGCRHEMPGAWRHYTLGAQLRGERIANPLKRCRVSA